MTAGEFAAALGKLRLPHTAARTTRLLGVSGRQIQRYCAGDSEVHPTVAVIVHLLLALDGAGIPPAAVAARLPGA